MEKQDLNDAEWTRIGFRFGIGFGLAVSIFAVIGALAGYVYTHHNSGSPANPTSARINPLPATVSPAQQSGEAAAHQGQLLVRIPPKDGKTCLQEAHGMIDDNYEACLKGREYWTHQPTSESSKKEGAQPVSQLQDEWAVQLSIAVRQAWTVPPGTNPEQKAAASITLSSDGNVESAFIENSSGVADFDDSLIQAINKASPLPLPENPAAFVPTVELCFSPDPKNCQ